MTFICSMNEPGHPCVMMSGSAFFSFDLHVNEMNVQPIDVRDEIRNGVDLRLGLAPVVVGGPVARELLHRRELDTLRFIVDRFLLGPLRRLDAPAQIGEIGFRKAHMKRTNVGLDAV